VIMWSLANESFWGSNFQKEYDYAKAEDTTRPVIFSYPITQPQGTRAYDIWSLHYAGWDCDPSSKADNFSIGESWGHDAPVLHDEYAHGPCYDLPEQMRDRRSGISGARASSDSGRASLPPTVRWEAPFGVA